MSGKLKIDAGLLIDAEVYLFKKPRSYTGQDLAEIHINSNASVTEALLSSLLEDGLRMAEPGEFTARAYLNGKMDLTQAEAVNEVIVSSNRFQLAAAEKLLAGRLTNTTEKVKAEIMECLSLIEAGMDFSAEDIEFINADEAVGRFRKMNEQLQQLLSGSISYEAVIDLPAVGIAGAPNAGKSSLLNKLLGTERSIVSKHRMTTRDVLTGRMSLNSCDCVLFDSAGLITEPHTIIDELAQTAAIEAIGNAAVVVFCVDISNRDWTEDRIIRRLIKSEAIIAVAAKADLIDGDMIDKRLIELKQLFGVDFLLTSSVTGFGIEDLKRRVDKVLIEMSPAYSKADSAMPIEQASHGVALTARHKHVVTQAAEYISEAEVELPNGNEEVVAMLLRAAYQELSGIEQEHLDERILDNIFSRFCIGK
ncbi:MAG: tRNA modification GTPase [Planctomycetota bacterium]